MAGMPGIAIGYKFSLGDYSAFLGTAPHIASYWRTEGNGCNLWLATYPGQAEDWKEQKMKRDAMTD